MRFEKSKALLCLKLLVEGNSIRSTERITTVHRDTILHLLEVVGTRCEQVMEEYIRNIPLGNVEADEIWGFVGKKEGHKKEEEKKNTRRGRPKRLPRFYDQEEGRKKIQASDQRPVHACKGDQKL